MDRIPLRGEGIVATRCVRTHGTVMGNHNLEVSGDLPGAASRFVEQFCEGKFVEDRDDAGWKMQLQPQDEPGGNGKVES